MPSKTSPGGSMFPYYYKNGELFGLHMGSFGADEAGAIARLKAEEVFFIEQHKRMGFWIDFYQTKLTDKLLDQLIELLAHAGSLISKLGLVGCSSIDRWRINRRIKKAGGLSTLPVKYFDDPEEAKTWLVSERG